MKTLQDTQQKLFEMLIYLDEIFKENKIHYCLVGGSVIGSVRHKGFIPWDDDIDIAIIREHFTKAEYILSKLNNYFYEPVEKQIIRNSPIGRLHYLNNEYAIEYSPTIDLFPIDRVPNSKILIKVQFLCKNIYHLCIYRNKTKNRGTFMNFLSGLLLVLPDKFLDFLQNISFRIFTHWEKNKKMKLAILFGNYGYKEIFDRKMFEETRLGLFNGRLIPLPSDPDKYLTTLFGNYMELPPLEERKPKHRVF